MHRYRLCVCRPCVCRPCVYRFCVAFVLVLMAVWGRSIQAQASAPEHVIGLHAARLLKVETGKVLKPGEVLVKGELIVQVGTAGKRSGGTEDICIGGGTLLPGGDYRD